MEEIFSLPFLDAVRYLNQISVKAERLSLSASPRFRRGDRVLYEGSGFPGDRPMFVSQIMTIRRCNVHYEIRSPSLRLFSEVMWVSEEELQKYETKES